MNEANDAEWMRARDALKAFTAAGHNPAEVEAMIAAYLRNGDLNARAAAIWKSDERFTSAAWKTCPPDAEGGPVPLRYWRLEKNIIEDRAQWRIVADRFLMTSRLKPRQRIMMKGVEFSTADLKRIQPTVFGGIKPKTKRGRPAEIAKRDAAWITAIKLLLRNNRVTNFYTSGEALADAMAVEAQDECGTTPFGDQQRREVGRQAHQIWVSPEQ